MKVVRGDLLKLALAGRFDVIVHGCNCGNAMGAGIALAIRKEFPEAYRADGNTPKWDRSKMGSISHATVKRGNRHEITVVNGYTQYHWKGRGTAGDGETTLVDYEALRSVMRLVKVRFGGQKMRMGYPRIGAGLAGGDWTIIAQIIDEELEGEDHTLVEYSRGTD